MQFQRWLLWLAVSAVFVCLSSARAVPPRKTDRDIVFAAQRYRWSGEYYRYTEEGEPHETLANISSVHLYRVNPDGTKLTQITSGSDDDYFPQWSPDGRSLLFVRSHHKAKSEQTSEKICISDADGHVKESWSMPRGFHLEDNWTNQRHVEYSGVRWSRDGWFIAAIVTARDASPCWNEKRSLLLIDRTTHRKRRFAGISRFLWSPSGHSLYVETDKEPSEARLLDAASGQIRRLGPARRHTGWLSNDQLIGDVPGDRYNVSAIFDWQGREVRRIRWQKQLFNEERLWLPLRNGRTAFVVMYSGTSDGGHCTVSWVDLDDGKVHDLFAGNLIAMSPDGLRCAVTEDPWVGPYKRGGRRCGALEILDRSTGKRKTITPPLMEFYGGDWR